MADAVAFDDAGVGDLLAFGLLLPLLLQLLLLLLLLVLRRPNRDRGGVRPALPPPALPLLIIVGDAMQFEGWLASYR